jgi:hypothetical protein
MPNFNPERARQYRIIIENILKQFGEADKGKYRPHEVRISHRLTTLCNNLRFDQFTPVFSPENQQLHPQRANMSQNDRIQDSAQNLVNAVDQEIQAAQDQCASSCLSLFAGKPKERIVDRLMKTVLPAVFPGEQELSRARAFSDASVSPVVEVLRSPSLLATL